MQTPSGRWYFKGRPDDPATNPAADIPLSDDVFALLPPGHPGADDQRARAWEFAASMQGDPGPYFYGFHTRPDDELMTPLLESFAKALGRMPSLKKALLRFDAQRYLFLSFLAPGHAPQQRKPKEIPLPYYLHTNPPPIKLRQNAPPAWAPRLFVYLQGWRMGSALEGVFAGEGRRVYGVETVVRHLDYDELVLDW